MHIGAVQIPNEPSCTMLQSLPDLVLGPIAGGLFLLGALTLLLASNGPRARRRTGPCSKATAEQPMTAVVDFDNQLASNSQRDYPSKIATILQRHELFQHTTVQVIESLATAFHQVKVTQGVPEIERCAQILTGSRAYYYRRSTCSVLRPCWLGAGQVRKLLRRPGRHIQAHPSK
jgi:hypothetical protein